MATQSKLLMETYINQQESQAAFSPAQVGAILPPYFILLDESSINIDILPPPPHTPFSVSFVRWRVMGCGAAEATGLCFVCFVVINPRVLSANRVDFGLFS